MKIKLTTKQRDELLAIREFGRKAELANEVLDVLVSLAIEWCKNEFASLPVVNYHDIDKERLFMLQFEMKAVREFQTAIKLAILAGKEANENLNKDVGGY